MGNSFKKSKVCITCGSQFIITYENTQAGAAQCKKNIVQLNAKKMPLRPKTLN